MSYCLDLFSGAGGFSLGAHDVIDEVLGIELDTDAVATQHAAGMACEQADITELNPEDYDPRRENPGTRLHLHASPPCQTFSSAGKGAGRKHLDVLSMAVRDILTGGEVGDDVDLADIPEGSLLVLEPARWIAELMPDTISMEQVRSVLPIWEAYADGLEFLGYKVWTALLHAEQHGVPQTRVRAWLGASLHREVEAPTPTHSKYHTRKPERLDEGVLPWVSMAEALGWGHIVRPVPTVTAGGTGSGGAEPFGQRVRNVMDEAANGDDWVDLVGFPRRADSDDVVEIDGVAYRARDFRKGDQPSFNLTSKARSWTHMKANDAGEDWTHLRQSSQKRATTRAADEPAPTLAPGHASGDYRLSNDPDDWGYEKQPATTVQGDPRIWPRGHKINQADIDRLGKDEATERYGDRAGKKARRVTIEEAGVLQGFPINFPWQGSKTSQFRQAGNAVNPQVARAVLRTVL